MPYRLAEDKPPIEPPPRRRPTRRRRAALRTIAVLPTLCTLGNLLCGFTAIFFASRSLHGEGDLPWGWTPLTFAAVFIFAGMVLDGLDGRIARLTRSLSDLGEQLDSMADMVTFGVAPAFIAVQVIGIETPFVSERSDLLFDRVALVIAGIYVACAALRLARFNLEVKHPDTSVVTDHLSFSGLPTPGAAGTVAGLVLLHQHFLARYDLMHWLIRCAAIGMVLITLLVALAMVSRLRYVHVINRYVRGRAPFNAIVMVVVIVLLLVVHPQGSIAAGFVVYALSAPAVRIAQAVRHRSPPAD